jgi:pyruvate-formate lyase
MLDRVNVNSESMSTMLLRLRQLSASASTDTLNTDVTQGNPAITRAFAALDYLVVDKLKTPSGPECRLYSTLTLRQYLSQRQIELLKGQIETEKQKIENTNKNKSIFTSTITTTEELKMLENKLEEEEGRLPKLQDDPKNDGIYMTWNGGEFQDWYNPIDGRSMYQFLVDKNRLSQRQEEVGIRRTQRQRPSNYLEVFKIVKGELNIYAEKTYYTDVKSLRRYENPESYEWWESKGKKLEDCELKEGQDHFTNLQASPQFLYKEYEANSRHSLGEDIFWSYADADKERRIRLQNDENNRRLLLPEQAVFWEQYKMRFQSF